MLLYIPCYIDCLLFLRLFFCVQFYVLKTFRYMVQIIVVRPIKGIEVRFLSEERCCGYRELSPSQVVPKGEEITTI
jgi:hypothetical protein